MDISFFAKPAAWDKKHNRLERGSSVVRGEQIAEYLGAKLNPTQGYEDNVCIYIKPWINTKFAKNSYIDIMDTSLRTFYEFNLLHIPIIVSSLLGYECLKEFKVIYIPQHHCNYERIKRIKKEITTVGIIGYHATFMYPIEEIRKRLAEIGLDLLVEFKAKNRQDVVEFYKKIDIQIVWVKNNWVLKNALKLYNAASFGIPTVAHKQKVYKEFEGYYIPVTTMDETIREIIKLKEDKEYYARYSELIIPKAEEYHISNIAKLYKQLN